MCKTQYTVDLGIITFSYVCLIDFVEMLMNTLYIVSTCCFKTFLQALSGDFSTVYVVRNLSFHALNILPEGGAL